MEPFSHWALSMLSGHPLFASVLAGVGAMRLVIPPVVTAVKAIVKATPTQKDDRLLDDALSSVVWNRTLDVISWLSSVGDLDSLKKKKG